MTTRGTRTQRFESWVATGFAVGDVSDVPVGILDLIRGHYVEGIFQVAFLAPMGLLFAYLLYRRAQRS
jgi:hypothetical protein